MRRITRKNRSMKGHKVIPKPIHKRVSDEKLTCIRSKMYDSLGRAMRILWSRFERYVLISSALNQRILEE